MICIADVRVFRKDGLFDETVTAKENNKERKKERKEETREARKKRKKGRNAVE